MKRSAVDLSIPQLRCFIAVAGAGSVAEAGRRLGLSGASVSKAITRLEASVGVRLLHRSTHAMSITEDGEALLDLARETLRAADAFEDLAADRTDGGGSGVVRVTASVGFVRNVIVPLVGELGARHPEIRLDVRATNELVDLADAGIDLAIRSGSFAGIPGHLQQPWFSFPWVICAAPSYLARRGTPTKVAELDAHDLVGFRNQRTGRIASWPFRIGRYEPAPRCVFDDGDSVWGTMLAGAGLACAPLYLAAPSLRDGRAVEVLRKFRDADVRVAMVRRDRKLTPRRVAAVIAFLTTRAPDLRAVVKRR